jgi:hypothetical protein
VAGLQCVVEQHSVYYFAESTIRDNRIIVASPGDCCVACLNHGLNGGSSPSSGDTCNLWTFCPEEEGCTVDEVVHHPLTGEPGRVKLSLLYQECLLQFDKGSVRHLATASLYQNRNVTSSNVTFISGETLLTTTTDDANLISLPVQHLVNSILAHTNSTMLDCLCRRSNHLRGP